MLILDTHIWIWLLTGEERLEKSGLLPKIVGSAKKSAVYISAISLWETAMLIQRGRISVLENTGVWFQSALSAPGISVLPLTADISIESTSLPGSFHEDPADQIIVATARLHDAWLVTADQKIIRYAEEGHLRLLAAA